MPSLAGLTALSLLCLTEATRHVRWYVNAGAVDANTAFVKDHADAITGAYLCCGLAHVGDDGNVTYKFSEAEVKSFSAPLQAVGIETFPVFSPSQAAVQNGTAAAGVPALVQFALATGVDGLCVDYEPSSNYTDAHAEAYASFLMSLSHGLHSSGLLLAMDTAGWGILDRYALYADAGVDVLMEMTPTYYGTNTTKNQDAVKSMLAGMRPEQVSVGVGSMVEGGGDWDYNWTAESLGSFLTWVAQSNVSHIGVWRADIDHYNVTKPFFIDALAAYLKQ